MHGSSCAQGMPGTSAGAGPRAADRILLARAWGSLFADSNFFGTAMGITESFLSLAWVIGPLLGGYAADLAGFAAPFLLTAALALLFTPALAWLMPAGAYMPPCALCCP